MSLNVAHPAKILFYKLLSLRNYDISDLRLLKETGILTKADVQEVDQRVYQLSLAKPDGFYRERKETLNEIFF